MRFTPGPPDTRAPARGPTPDEVASVAEARRLGDDEVVYPAAMSLARGGAAPYTEEAAAKIRAAWARLGPGPRDETALVETRLRAAVAHMRRVFQEAGYDYDATIVRFVEDTQKNPTQIPPRSIFFEVVYGLAAMTGGCRSAQVDCPALFSPAAGAAIRQFMQMEQGGPRGTPP